MNHRLIKISKRRQYLVAIAASQRLQIASHFEKLHQPLAIVKLGLSALYFVRKRYFWIIGGVGLLAAIRANSTLRWVFKVKLAWQLIRQLLK